MTDCNERHIPGWAKRVDEFGKHRWNKERPVKNRSGEYIGNIIFNIIFLWIVNKVPDWDLVFIRDNYSVVLWILNLSIIFKIAGNSLILMTNMDVVRYISNIMTEAAGFVAQIVLFYIYPFDFSQYAGLHWLDLLLPVFLIIGMVVSVIKVLNNLWKLVFWR